MIELLLFAAAQGWTVYAPGNPPKPKDHVEFYGQCIGERLVSGAWNTKLSASELLSQAQLECRPKAKEFKPQLKSKSANERLARVDADYAKRAEGFVCVLRAAVDTSVGNCEVSDAAD